MQTAENETALVLWAYDPFERESRPVRQAAKDLEHWAGEQGALLLPVYVATPSPADTSLGLLAPAGELCGKIDLEIRKLGLERVLPAEVLVEPSAGPASSARKLVELAERRNALAVAISSHGRSGLERFALGSFAEALLREAGIPLLFLPRSHGGPLARKRALFATDFSDNSHGAWKRFLPVAAESGLSLRIFHTIKAPVSYTPGEGVYIPENYFADTEAWARGKAAGWIAEAAGGSLSVDLELRDGGAGMMTGDVILRAARDWGAGMIVLASTSGLLDRALFGSAAYEVFRAAPCPVLVYGPRALGAGPGRGGAAKPEARSGR